MDIENFISNNTLKIFVKPNSNKTEIVNLDKNNKIIKVNVKAPAEKNKANVEIIKFFSKLLKKRVIIKKGLKSRKKILEIKV